MLGHLPVGDAGPEPPGSPRTTVFGGPKGGVGTITVAALHTRAVAGTGRATRLGGPAPGYVRLPG